MQSHKILGIFFAAILLAGCGNGGGGGGGGGGNGYSCTLPCLVATPLMSPPVVNTATGGIVNVSFTLTADASNVVVFLASTDVFSPSLPAGSEIVLNPMGGTLYNMAIVVNAGVATGTYYPTFAITAFGVNSGSEYYIDPTKSQSQYTYVEVLDGGASSPALSPFAISTLLVQ